MQPFEISAHYLIESGERKSFMATYSHSKGRALIIDYTENYMENVFYFCLKKTSDRKEAEELTQDISFNIVSALERNIPENFPAWVWQIARNRYSVWASEKHDRSEKISGTDISDYDLPDTTDVSDGLIEKEQLSLLRRELAFIAGEYRDVILAYYMENRSVKEIAKSLRCAEGTVKSRLFRARNILKEGMDMAREFGVRSYKPEEISFVANMSNCGLDGQPWSVLIDHLLYKNIFLEAYGNPETAEQLSLELGVSLPYMECELEFLRRETFLKKDGDKYYTAFPIISRSTQETIHAYNETITREITSKMEQYVDHLHEKLGGGLFGGYVDYETAKWTLIMRLFDRYCVRYMESYTKRPRGGEWDICGYQTTNAAIPAFVGLNGSGRNFEQYIFRYKGISGKIPDTLDSGKAETLEKLALGEDVSGRDRTLEELEKYGYVKKAGDKYALNIVVIKEDAFSYSDDVLRALETDIRTIFRTASEFSTKIVKNELPDYFAGDEQAVSVACDLAQFKRGYVLEQAIADGWLKYDENIYPCVGAHVEF